MFMRRKSKLLQTAIFQHPSFATQTNRGRSTYHLINRTDQDLREHGYLAGEYPVHRFHRFRRLRRLLGRCSAIDDKTKLTIFLFLARLRLEDLALSSGQRKTDGLQYTIWIYTDLNACRRSRMRNGSWRPSSLDSKKTSQVGCLGRNREHKSAKTLRSGIHGKWRT
ncbi:uncharacterized protein BKA55DRAFT_679386 [Fusarium redolens]|uniref:Uncharacterized protein n=1 Tax=Fusarium redolens TaxID=48865 RepID=A0A9P9GEN0_FUSRE|nr:uncharacterized protein BKA55DRAFT_679386 [Fusarium redolens]KAH7237140.1 hypothetical protein BKA55DRAFT_679386 [Fusarium redolens]